MDKRYQAWIGVGITFIIAVCSSNDFIRFLLGFEIVALLVLFAEVRYLRNKVEIQLKLPETVVGKTEQFPVHIVATNTSKIPIPKIRVQVILYDKWSKRDLGASGVFLLDGNETGTMQLSFSPGYCGVYEVRVSSYRVWDHLGIFSIRHRPNLHERTLYVLPEKVTGNLLDVALSRDEIEGESAEFRQGKSTVDTSDIREYRMGDNVRHIHWKLSAKTLELMIREMGEPQERMNQIYLNLQYKDKKPDRETWEEFLTTVAKLSGRMVNVGHSHNVFWIDIEIRKIIEYRVTDTASLQEMLCGLLHAACWKEGEVRDVLEEIRWHETMEEVIEINLQGDIISSGGER